MDVEKEVESLQGAQKSLDTALRGLMELMEKNNKQLDANNILTDKMYVALNNHTKNDETWRIEIKEFMDKIYKCIWGNGVPGIKTQLFVLWGGGSLLFGFVIWLAFQYFSCHHIGG